MKENNCTISPESRLIDLSVGELMTLINDSIQRSITDLKCELPSMIENACEEDPMCNSREDIARLLGVTASTVWRYYNRGVFGDSVTKLKGKMVGKKTAILKAVRAYNNGEYETH